MSRFQEGRARLLQIERRWRITIAKLLELYEMDPEHPDTQRAQSQIIALTRELRQFARLLGVWRDRDEITEYEAHELAMRAVAIFTPDEHLFGE